MVSDFLLHIAIGDAYGRAFEWATAKEIAPKNNLHYREYEEKKLNPLNTGRYTDDTQMSIALAEHMISGEAPMHDSFMRFFMAAYKRDPIAGYSRGMKMMLTLPYRKNALSMIKPYREENGEFNMRKSNGCVMRAIPAGLLKTPQEVMHYSFMQASTTHAELDCVFASTCVALFAHYYYYKPKYEKIFNDPFFFIDCHLGTNSSTRLLKSYRAFEPIKMEAMHTAAFCITLCYNVLKAGYSMSTLLKKSIAPGGDVDSTAAICMGLGSLMDIRNDLPLRLYKNLRNDDYGKDYIEQLGLELTQKFPA